MSTQTSKTLSQLVDELLMHGFKAEIVENEHGSYGIALILDGWYTSRNNDWALDAESVLPFWQEIVDRLREAASAERSSS